MSVYKGKTKSEKDGKTYWNDTGHTLFVEEKNGQQMFGMVDARNPGVKVYFFAVERRQSAPAAVPTGAASNIVEGDFGDLPF